MANLNVGFDKKSEKPCDFNVESQRWWDVLEFAKQAKPRASVGKPCPFCARDFKGLAAGLANLPGRCASDCKSTADPYSQTISPRNNGGTFLEQGGNAVTWGGGV